jgi:hypothetical protein
LFCFVDYGSDGGEAGVTGVAFFGVLVICNLLNQTLLLP